MESSLRKINLLHQKGENLQKISENSNCFVVICPNIRFETIVAGKLNFPVELFLSDRNRPRKTKPIRATFSSGSGISGAPLI